MSENGGLETLSSHAAFGGTQTFFKHESVACGGPMKVSVFLPPPCQPLAGFPLGKVGPRPALYFLAGLTCTEETFAMKAGAQRVAAELGLVLVTCDTSPRSQRFEGDDASWDFGLGAGFYLDATEAPWSAVYRMETYVTRELIAAVEGSIAGSGASQPIDKTKRGIFGHSMGGHGALSLSLRHPGLYQSVSALAPICAPSVVPWGEKAFSNYLGPDRADWKEHDTVALLESRRFTSKVLVDQGLADKFLQRELSPHLLEEACRKTGQDLELRLHAGYDHGYYFVATFVEDHLRHHASVLFAST